MKIEKQNFPKSFLKRQKVRSYLGDRNKNYWRVLEIFTTEWKGKGTHLLIEQIAIMCWYNYIQ